MEEFGSCEDDHEPVWLDAYPEYRLSVLGPFHYDTSLQL